MKKLFIYLLLFLGIIFFVTGLLFVFLYFKDAVILRIGEPDQSLIFWYLPILFIGIGGILASIKIWIVGYNSLKNAS